MFLWFKLVVAPSKAFGIIWEIVDLILFKNKNFCIQKNNFNKSQKHDFALSFLHNINKKNSHVDLIFQNFWSYRSIRSLQIATDYSVFDRFCFLCVVCLFWWFYGFLWRVFAIEKLEYSICNAKIKYEFVCNSTYSNGLLSYTNGSHEGFVEFCVIEVFKFWVMLRWMKE